MSTLRKSLVTALAAATLLGLSPVVGYSDAAAQFRRPPPGGGMRPGPGPMRAAPGRNRGGGGAAAGAAFGLIAGALISGAMEQQRQQEYQRQYQRQRVYESADDDEVEYCMSRFRSYDPRSGTYRGLDGRRYRCP